MCDYSIHASVATRAARVGDKLISTNFKSSITRGFADVQEPHVAVCLRPGTELAFERPVEVDYGLGRLPARLGLGKVPAMVARFCHVNEDQPDAHHDALEFPDGRILLVTRLCTGQMATVLQLPAGPREQRPRHEEATTQNSLAS